MNTTDFGVSDNTSILLDTAMEASNSNITKLSDAAYLASGVYLTIIGVFAIVGNSVVLMVLLRDPRLRGKPHNMLLVNLAVADLLCLLGGYWATASSGYMRDWIYGDVVCTVVAFWTFCMSLTSMNTLVAICVFRYVMICLPGKSFILTQTVTLYVILITWMYSGFWSGLPLLGWGGYAYEPFVTSCSLDWADHSYSNTTYLVGCIFFCYVLHLTIMIKCYRSISLTVSKIADRDRQRGRVVSADEVVHSAIVTDDQMVTRMCFLVVLVFVGVWTPYAVICAVHIFYADMPLMVTAIPTMCAKAGCMLNPITYFITNKSFRSKTLVLLCGCKQTNAVGSMLQGSQCKEQFDKVTKEGVYIGSEIVTLSDYTRYELSQLESTASYLATTYVSDQIGGGPSTSENRI